MRISDWSSDVCSSDLSDCWGCGPGSRSRAPRRCRPCPSACPDGRNWRPGRRRWRGNGWRWRGRGGWASWWLWLAWLLLCVAAARPQQLGEAVQPPQAGRDLMLAVDLSGSMGEEDMTLGNAVGDRLTAAKAVIADFLDRRAGDRVGLLVFGQKAYALTPLTLDRES